MQYNMCRPVNKYLDAFISDEEMAMIETIAKFVEKEVFPKRLDLEGGWHRDEKLAEDTLDDLYAKLVALGYQKLGVPKAYGGLGISTALRLALNEEFWPFGSCRKGPCRAWTLCCYRECEKGQGVCRQIAQ
jgi:alkylation response protein AidB-like acyl-CoA dehydrogenase